MPYTKRDVTAGIFLETHRAGSNLSTSCTEQCHDMALRGNTFFLPVLLPITAFFFHGNWERLI